MLSSRWLRYNSTSAALFGIPQPSDLGRISVFVDNDEYIDVEVVEETENPCAGQVTNWMEFHYPNNVTHETYESLRDILYAIADVVNDRDVTKMRVYPHSYLSRHRSGRYSLEDPSLPGGPDQLVITCHINCDALDDDRVGEIIERMPGDYRGVFQVFAGRVIPAERRENRRTTSGCVEHTEQPNHGEYTSFEDFVHRRLIWLTDKQKEELKNITVEYFDKMEAKINEFVDALKMQTQKEIAKEYTRLFGVAKASRKRRDEGHQGLEDNLKTYLSWLTDEQKEQIRALKAEGKTKEELQAKIREFYDAATGETKEMVTELLKDACRRKKVEEYGDSCKKIFGMGSSRSRHERHVVSGED